VCWKKKAGKMPDKTQGRLLPVPQKRVQKQSHAPVDFDSEALIFKMTGVAVGTIQSSTKSPHCSMLFS
jgi:hypothetical protein